MSSFRYYGALKRPAAQGCSAPRSIWTAPLPASLRQRFWYWHSRSGPLSSRTPDRTGPGEFVGGTGRRWLFALCFFSPHSPLPVGEPWLWSCLIRLSSSSASPDARIDVKKRDTSQHDRPASTLHRIPTILNRTPARTSMIHAPPGRIYVAPPPTPRSTCCGAKIPVVSQRSTSPASPARNYVLSAREYPEASAPRRGKRASS